MIVYIWGTGRLTGKILGNYIELKDIEGFIDNDIKQKEYMGKKVLRPKELLNIDYDAVLVVNLHSLDIYNQCLELGINLEKIIFLYENYILEDLNKDYDFVAKILNKKNADIIKERYHIIRGVETQKKLFLNNWEKDNSYLKNDYIRIKCFELVVKEIKKRKIQGAVAEAGVFRGEFAQFINYAFPDNDIYLFDTFDGFEVSEAEREIKNGNCTDAFVEAYKKTNIEDVLLKMPYPDKVCIKQGIFPDSINGLEEKYIFVSLDMDFEQSIYAGLEYFYPRLQAGGYLFVHDYTSNLQGVEIAVDRYEQKIGKQLCKVPLCDANGTLVITK